MKLKYRADDMHLTKNIIYDGWYSIGHFYIKYYSLKMRIFVKRDITCYADEEMKTYFQTLNLLKDHSSALKFNLIYNDDHYDIDIDSIH